MLLACKHRSIEIAFVFSERTQLRLGDIAENIAAVQEYAADMTFAQFTAQRLIRDAIERCLQRITEAVIQIGSEEMTQIAPNVPFERVSGLGNMLRHEYHRIDSKQIFTTIHEELPALQAAIQQALQS
ncbi:hypothetical protein BH10PSE15_BH10PSE15_06670 [soil metagenome]